MKIGTFGNYMRLQLQFKNIVDNPMCRIYLCQQLQYEGSVKDLFDFTVDCANTNCELRIEHWDKQPKDTKVENGVIVRDRSFELASIRIDNYDLKELVWQSKFVAQDGTVYPSCLFFGPNGNFLLEFSQPVLYWILKNRNEPGWQEDYKYYETACRLLTQI